ncbi:response regulator [Sphingomonas segetis]|jgi:two-component system nitrate/nitrite response regulator NarP|uniref:response regulator n=1 Tax=Sphingomonas segetis TaxID=1104779 RepID=UPI0018AD30E2|nr:response regulator transcription factor [Sphingomonas segetis]
MTRVMLADDHPMIAAALDVLLRGTDYELVGRARSGSDALAEVARLKPDLLLLDVNMPDGSGLDVLRDLRERRSAPAVVLLTAGMDDSQLLVADRLGPEGMVLKTSDPALLLECMEQVRKGEHWADPEIAERTRHAKERAASAPSLTPRERELVELVRQGLRNRDIAAQLGVTEGTVKVYLHAIFDKLGVDNRTELAMRGAELLG